MTNWGDVYKGLCWSEFLIGAKCAEEMSCETWRGSQFKIKSVSTAP